MMSFLSSVMDFVAAHPQLAYAAAFLLALSEAVPLLGTIVPGSSLIVATAALVPTGAIKLWPLLIATVAGAIVGDGFSFWLGRHYHQQVIGRWPLNRFPDLVTRSQAFFAKHGDKSVFLGRFTPALRAFVPLIAGISRMSAQRFYVANVTSALLWGPAHILPGLAIGGSVALFGAAAARLAVLLAIVAFALWLLVQALLYGRRRGVPIFLAGLERMRRWTNARSTWPRRQLRALLDPRRHESQALALLAILLVGAAWLFFGVLEDVVSGDPLVRTDTAIYVILQDLRTPLGDSIMIALTELGDEAVVIPVIAVVLAWLAWKRAWRPAVYWLAAVGGASAINTVIKVALHRTRPGEWLYSGWSAFSFPSGHSTVNIVMYGFLALLIARQVRPAWRLAVAFGAASLALLIALSRLYLGAHWFSDVIGGLAFGTAWLALLGISYVSHWRGRTEPRGLLALVFSGLLLFGSLNIYRQHPLDTQLYAVRQSTPTIAVADWWATGWQNLAPRRISLEGEMEEPLAVQWAGSLERLADTLSRRGWKPALPWTAPNALAWFAPEPDAAGLPAIPHLHGGLLPSLTLILLPQDEAEANSRLVLRLWATNIELTNGGVSPLWIGSVVEERLDRRLSLVTVASIRSDMNAPREHLAAGLEAPRLATRTAGSADRNWDGRVLLASAHSEPTP